MTDDVLVNLLKNINEARGRGTPDLSLLKEYARDAVIVRQLDRVDNRLIVYGSLAPGEINHSKLADLIGTWQPVTVAGRLMQQGWGEHVGFPGFTWDPRADAIDARMFTSSDLPMHWPRLDAFEGSDYRRILVPAQLATKAIVVANIYEVVTAAN